MRTMSEQAQVPGMGWLLRTTLYSPHYMSTAVAFIPGNSNTLYTPIAP